MKKIEFAVFMQKAIDLVPKGSEKVQRAIALSLRAEYLCGMADEALDSLEDEEKKNE